MRRNLKRNGGFFWGLALGLIGALGLIVANDLQWRILPSAGASAPETETPTAAAAAASIFVPGGVPEGVEVRVDGEAVKPRPATNGIRVPVRTGARRVEFRNHLGALWTTRLAGDASDPDTLRPLLGGEIVIEVQRQAAPGPVRIDGVPVGSAPGTVEDVPSGWHLLAVGEDGEPTFQDAVLVRPGQVTIVSVPPRPAKGRGRLGVRSRLIRERGFSPSEGEPVSIDGVATGETPLELELDAGFHSIRVERGGFDPLIEVVYLPAGQMRHVDADFGREDVLHVSVAAPAELTPGEPAAIPVSVLASGESVRLTRGELLVLPEGQSKPISVPLVPSGQDPKLWVAVVPPGAVPASGNLLGYAACVDDLDRRGASEIFRVSVR